MTKTRLIQSRFNAFLVVAATGFVAYPAIRAALHQHVPHSARLFPPLPFLPDRVRFALDVFYGLFIVWVLITLFRKTSDKERFIVACWLVTFLFALIRPLVTPVFAISIQYAKGLAMGAAFLMSILMAFSFFSTAELERDRNAS